MTVFKFGYNRGMIKAKLENDIYTVDEDFNVTGKDKGECKLISQVIEFEKGEMKPSSGFLVSNIALALQRVGFKILEVVDKEMEESKPNTIY